MGKAGRAIKRKAGPPPAGTDPRVAFPEKKVKFEVKYGLRPIPGNVERPCFGEMERSCKSSNITIF
jgi:hypothetical protein